MSEKIIKYNSRQIDTTALQLKRGDVVSAELWNGVLNLLVSNINTHDCAIELLEQFETALKENSEWIFDGGDAHSKIIMQHVDVPGTVYITSDPNINPAALFGGTWESFDKAFAHSSEIIEFKDDIGIKGYKGKVGYNTCYNSNAIDKMEIYCHRADHTVRFRINCYLKAGYTFTDIEVSPFIEMDWKEFGFTELSAGYTAILASNDWFHPAGLVIKVEHDNTIIQLDVMGIPMDSSRSWTVPNNVTEPITIDFTTPINIKYMLDEFCDKFYWRRTT